MEWGLDIWALFVVYLVLVAFTLSNRLKINALGSAYDSILIAMVMAKKDNERLSNRILQVSRDVAKLDGSVVELVDTSGSDKSSRDAGSF